MWYLIQPTIEEDDPYFFTSIACALENVNQHLQSVESRLLKSGLKSANTEKEPDKCTLMASICRTLSCLKYSTKTPNELIKHVHFRPSSDDPVSARRPMPFPDIDCQSTCVLGMDPYDELVYQVVIPIPDEEQSEQYIATLRPNQP